MATKYKNQKSFICLGLAAVVSINISTTCYAIPISGGFVPTGTSQYETTAFFQNQNFYYDRTNDFPGSDVRFRGNAALIGGNYAFNKNMSMNVILPYLTYDYGGSAVPFAPNFYAPFTLKRQGLGDPIIGMSHRIQQTEGEGWFWSSGIGVSLGLPLGSNDDPTVPHGLRVGTGNFTPGINLSSFYQSLDKGMAAANIAYLGPIKRMGYKWPSQFQYNLSFSRNIYPFVAAPDREYPIISALVLEFLGTYLGKQDSDFPFLDGLDGNTGGNLIKIAPGIQFEGLGWQVAFSYQTPISQRWNGMQTTKFDHTFLVQLVNSNLYS